MFVRSSIRALWPRFAGALALTLCLAAKPIFAAPVEVQLATAGKPAVAIVTSATASKVVQESAATLAEFLGKISGAKFLVTTGDGKTGIALGTVADFPGLGFENTFGAEDGTHREDYILRTHEGGLYAIGSTELGVRHAIWDILYRLGYRQFFPGPNWEIVPSVPAPKLAVDSLEHPDFLARRLWYGFGTWADMRKGKEHWDAVNRMGAGLDISAGHSYEAIITANKAEFEKHPEYFSSRKAAKLCISNPGLRQLVIDYAINFFTQHPDKDSIAMEPSDGGWPDDNTACGDGQTYKSISDRVVTLANAVAEAVNQKFKNKYVGIYAYYMHSAPPTIKVNPHVIPNVATAYIQGGWTFDQLMQGWHKQGAQIQGVREYYSVFDSHRDRPAGPGGANVSYMATSIPHDYQMGGRAMSAESTESWGPAGLPFYLASRLLWNTKENSDALVEDFLTKSFGPAKEPMRAFYKRIDRSSQPLYTQSLIGEMYRDLDAALKLTKDPGIRSRLDDLILWTRYCELMWQCDNTPGDRKARGEAILKWTYRWRKSAMMHSYVLWRHSYKFDKDYPPETKFNVPPAKNPWMSDDPVPVEEIEGYVPQGIANNPVATFTPVQYGHDLVPATSLGLKSGDPGGFGFIRMKHDFYIWVDKPSTTLRFQVTGGYIATSANTTLSLYSAKAAPEADNDEDDTVPPAPDAAEAGGEVAAPPPLIPAGLARDPLAVDSVDAPNDLKPHVVELKAPTPGLYRLHVVDRGRGAGVNWPAGVPTVIESSKTAQTLLRGLSAMYFYVPKGTKVVGGYGRARGVIKDADGKPVYKLPPALGAFSIPVAPGQDGRLWKVDSATMTLLMTVPPYLARSAEEMLLPREVVVKDGK